MYIIFFCVTFESWINLICILGRGECPGPGHSIHLQRVARLFDFLADFRHNGRSIICWKILQGKYCNF